MLTSYLPALAKAEKALRREAWFTPEWFCSTGLWPDANRPEALSMKIAKRTWTHDTPKSLAVNRRSKSGIHFAVWLEQADAVAPRLHFGMHVFELPRESGPRLKSNDLTLAYRAEFRRVIPAWPGAGWGRGPRTPFAGAIPLVEGTLAEDTLEQLRRFKDTAAFIDAKLAQMHRRD